MKHDTQNCCFKGVDKNIDYVCLHKDHFYIYNDEQGKCGVQSFLLTNSFFYPWLRDISNFSRVEIYERPTYTLMLLCCPYRPNVTAPQEQTTNACSACLSTCTIFIEFFKLRIKHYIIRALHVLMLSCENVCCLRLLTTSVLMKKRIVKLLKISIQTYNQ